MAGIRLLLSGFRPRAFGPRAACDERRGRGVSDFLVDLRSLFEELAALLLEPGFERIVFMHSQAGGVVADVLSNLHRAEVRSAHAAEMRDLRSILRESFVVEFTGRIRIEREIELIFRSELEARLRESIMPMPRARVPLGEVGGMGGDLVSDDAVFDVLLVRQSEVFLWSYVAEHGGSEPTDHRGADPARDVIVPGGDIGHKRSQGIKRRLVANLQLPVHVLLDEVHRNMARAFDHYLTVVLPGLLVQLTQGIELRDLGLVVGVGS